MYYYIYEKIPKEEPLVTAGFDTVTTVPEKTRCKEPPVNSRLTAVP